MYHITSVLVLCEYSKIRIVTLLFDLKRVQLFETFKYLSLLHHAVFGNYNGDYSRQERNKLSPSLAPVVAIFSSYSRQNGDLGDCSRRKRRRFGRL